MSWERKIEDRGHLGLGTRLRGKVNKKVGNIGRKVEASKGDTWRIVVDPNVEVTWSIFKETKEEEIDSWA